MLELRPYQNEAIAAILDAKATRQLVCLPTGAGKTIIFSELARRLNHRTLILAHRDELIQQAVDKLRFVWPDADVGVVKAERNELAHQVTVASVQTVSRKSRLESLDSDYKLLITDEAHHATAATYHSVYEQVSDALHVGVTATPNRTDKVGLKAVYDEVVYERTILDLIRSGYLSDIRCLEIRADIDVSEAATSRGDYNAERLAPLLNTENANALIVDSWCEHASERPTLAFCADVGHAKALAAMFCKVGIKAASVDCRMDIDERREILSEFARGVIQVLTNYGILTEGYDAPHAGCVLLARPTKSQLLYTQMVGRGLRPFPGKADCLVLDVACISSKHDLVTFPDLFGLKDLPGEGETLTEAVDRETNATMQRTIVGWGNQAVAREVDPFAASRLVWIQTERGFILNLGTHGKLFVYVAREDAGRFHVFHGLNRELHQLTQTAVDVSWALGLAESHARKATGGRMTLVERDAPWRFQPATEKQKTTLRAFGVPFDPGITKGEASDLLSASFERRGHR